MFRTDVARFLIILVPASKSDRCVNRFSMLGSIYYGLTLLLYTPIANRREEIQKLPLEDKNHLFYVLDNILQNVRAKKAFAGLFLLIHIIKVHCKLVIDKINIQKPIQPIKSLKQYL